MVIVKITVYDLHKVEQDSLNYMSEHTEEFYDVNGLFDNNLFNIYRLNHMLDAKDTINYEILSRISKRVQRKYIEATEEAN